MELRAQVDHQAALFIRLDPDQALILRVVQQLDELLEAIPGGLEVGATLQLLRNGQVIGSTNKHAEHPVDRPIQFQEIFATLYAKAGLDLNTRQFDLRGRPQYLIDPGIQPIRELI